MESYWVEGQTGTYTAAGSWDEFAVAWKLGLSRR